MNMMKRRALISVFDKTGLVPFGKALAELGFELLSTGSTEKTLREAGVPVTPVADVTGFPECLDGRVKTLHPNIHAGILAMRANPEHMQTLERLGVGTIDIVACNLYPFKETILRPDTTYETAIENIDIGGPSMLRAAAKNGQDVAVIVHPEDYEGVLEDLRANGEVSMTRKMRLRYRAFAHTAAYDALIADYLHRQLDEDPYPETLTLTFEKAQDMRYGENPHQSAAFYRNVMPHPGSLADAEQLHGLALSYNNIWDAAGALELLNEFTGTGKAAAVAVKHANPCGVGLGETVFEAYTKAYEADPVSIFGGIVAFNGTVDAQTAEMLSKIFLEIIIAPDFDDDALKLLCKKKNLRLLKLGAMVIPAYAHDAKKVYGGLLMQQRDDALLPDERWTVVTKRAPTPREVEDLMLAWRVVKYTKSNGIAVSKNGQSLGIGPGQVNRIWAATAALERAGARAKGAAMASDAYFPFDDCLKAAAAAGVSCVIHPGGSRNDADSIAVADEFDMAMVVTGMRHFRH